MPYYEYSCASCHEIVSLRQGMASAPAEVCPKCGARALRRLLSPAMVAVRRPAPGENCGKRVCDHDCCAMCPHARA